MHGISSSPSRGSTCWLLSRPALSRFRLARSPSRSPPLTRSMRLCAVWASTTHLGRATPSRWPSPPRTTRSSSGAAGLPTSPPARRPTTTSRSLRTPSSWAPSMAASTSSARPSSACGKPSGMRATRSSTGLSSAALARPTWPSYALISGTGVPPGWRCVRRMRAATTRALASWLRSVLSPTSTSPPTPRTTRWPTRWHSRSTESATTSWLRQTPRFYWTSCSWVW